MAEAAKKEVALRANEAAQAPIEVTDVVHMIERLAANPQVDPAKLEKMLDLQERMMAMQAKQAFTEAMAVMQPTLPAIEKKGKIDIGRGKPQTYALWEDINGIITPILATHGFSLSFRTGREGTDITVTGVLSHRDGHSEETTMQLPADVSGSKNAVQAMGSSLSYGKRYVAQALLNLTFKGEDDDGEGAGTPKVSDEQREELVALADEVGADKAKFCEVYGLDSFADILASDYGKAKRALEQKRGKKVPA